MRRDDRVKETKELMEQKERGILPSIYRVIEIPLLPQSKFNYPGMTE